MCAEFELPNRDFLNAETPRGWVSGTPRVLSSLFPSAHQSAEWAWKRHSLTGGNNAGEITITKHMSVCRVSLMKLIKKSYSRASLVAQWLRICLPMQGTRVRALVWEDPTCRRATRPVSHNYWACASGACAPQQERPRQWEARAPWWRVAPTCHN